MDSALTRGKSAGDRERHRAPSSVFRAQPGTSMMRAKRATRTTAAVLLLIARTRSSSSRSDSAVNIEFPLSFD